MVQACKHRSFAESPDFAIKQDSSEDTSFHSGIDLVPSLLHSMSWVLRDTGREANWGPVLDRKQ